MLTLVPVGDRDYKNKIEVRQFFMGGDRFKVITKSSLLYGAEVSRKDLIDLGHERVLILYRDLRLSTVLQVIERRQAA